MEPNTPAVSAQPEAPAPTISAERAASDKGDFAAFETAHFASRRGAPLAAVPAPPADVTPAPAAEPTPAIETPERQLSKRQEKINEYERTIAELRTENARLRIPPTPAAPRSDPKPEPAAPAPTPFPAYDKYLETHPNADYESYMEDRALTRVRAELAERDRVAAVQSTEYQISQQVGARLHAAQAKGVDVPALLNAPLPIDPSMPGFGTMSGVIVRSDLQVELMQHFVAHPDEATRIAQMPPGVAFREISMLEGRLQARLDAAPVSTPAPPAPSTITAAPPPPPTLSRPGNASDPKASALSRGDFAAFDQLDLAARAAKRHA